jgi:hypothetical protein
MLKKTIQLVILVPSFCFALIVSVSAGNFVVGVMSGNWARYRITLVNPLGGPGIPTSMKVDFPYIDERNITLLTTVHFQNGSEINETMAIDLTTAEYSIPSLLISANSTVGHSFYFAPYGNVTITYEFPRKCAGAIRTVIGANVSQHGTTQFFYWDKVSGIMVEISAISSNQLINVVLSETSIWTAEPSSTNWWFWAIVIIAIPVTIVAAAFILRGQKPLITALPPQSQSSASSRAR